MSRPLGGRPHQRRGQRYCRGHFGRAFQTIAHDRKVATSQPLHNTLTLDKGKEMALHKHLTINTGMSMHFCDLHSSWQPGINENTNGLVRQQLPKGTDLSNYSQEQLDAIAVEINNRPHKGWQ